MNETAMEELETMSEAAELMKLLSDPTRLRVLALLRPGEMNVTTLCERLGLAQPTVSHHLGLLRSAHLVQTRRAGKSIYYSLNPQYVMPCEKEHGLHLHYHHVDMTVSCDGATNGHSVAAISRGTPTPRMN